MELLLVTVFLSYALFLHRAIRLHVMAIGKASICSDFFRYIVGDGSGRAQIEQMISEYGLNDKVVMIGRTTNPYVWMKNANLFVHSSFYEGFGLVLVEAMICGTVVLCSNCPVGPTEVLGNGKYGVLFDVGDDKGLSENLVQLLSNKEVLQKYENVLEEQINKFNSQKVIKEYEKIIDTVL